MNDKEKDLSSTGKKVGPISHKKKAQKDTLKTCQDEIKSLKSKLKKMEKEWTGLQDKMESLQDDYLRQMAERDNLRKRIQREKEEYFQFALSDVLKEFIVILDNFERAVENEDTTENRESFRKGIELIQKQYKDVLKTHGVLPIEIIDRKFDPNFHQAFATEESDDVDEPLISEEFQRGYTLHGRLLRPTLVKVIIPKKKE